MLELSDYVLIDGVLLKLWYVKVKWILIMIYF